MGKYTYEINRKRTSKKGRLKKGEKRENIGEKREKETRKRGTEINQIK